MTGLGEILPEINWGLILFTLLLSSAVALLGDILGMKIAKKRITLLGLRPKYTSSVITALTGMVIAFGIMVALSVLSDTVRTALFSMKYVQRQITELTASLQTSRTESELMEIQYIDSLEKLERSTTELEDTKEEISQLKSQRESLQSQIESLSLEASALRKGLEEVREGKVVAFAEELLAQEVVPEGVSDEDLLDIMARLKDKVRFVVSRRASMPYQDISVFRDEADERRVMDRCKVIDSRKVIRARAKSNVIAGEPIYLEYRVYESVQVYREGEILLRRALPPSMENDEIESALHSVLREVNGIAVRDGILADPLTRTVGQIDATDFYEAVERLKDASTPQIVEVLADRDIYTEGPVRVLLKVEPSGR
nr:DUF3084 domain-containing protein [uncultured Dethiosulfovibrio sp.]